MKNYEWLNSAGAEGSAAVPSKLKAETEAAAPPPRLGKQQTATSPPPPWLVWVRPSSSVPVYCNPGKC